MNKILILLFLFLAQLSSEEYPKTFEQLSTPLYKSIEPIKSLSDMKNIQKSSEIYLQNLENIKILGFEVDKTGDKKKTKDYLSKLRKLQKMHDYILHEINININLAIKQNDYEKFEKLTRYEFDGLLRNRAIMNKSLEFYNKNKSKKNIPIFDKKIKYKKLEIATSKEFFNVVSKSTYNSNSNKNAKRRKVYLEAIDKGEYISVNIINTNPYTVTVSMHDKYKNFIYDKNVRKVFPLKTGEKKEYIKLYRKLGSFSQSYSYSYSWIIGSIDSVHDDSYTYRLPYAKGHRHVVSQGFNGAATHKGHSQYAIDFAMPEGTKLYASRDGTVVKTKENSNKGGYDKKYASSGNYITIEHSDNTFAIYYHLEKNGVVVNVGDKVKRGDLIGYSGNTGYSSGPHLHFAVFKANSPNTTKSIPIKLLSVSGVVTEPRKGAFYTSK